MRFDDALAIGNSAFFGAVTGFLLADVAGLLVGVALAAAAAYVAARANVRPAIVATVLVGAMAGALIGTSIVEAICLPATCTALSATGGAVSAIISFVGVGLVAALVTRSFDEHDERAEAGLPPVEPGCEVDEDTSDND